MARGSEAKIKVAQKIANAFGSDYIGEVDKKIYVWADDGAEKVQIAISMTCPKSMVDIIDEVSDENSFPAITPSREPKETEFTQEERDTINELMAKLGF